MAKYNAKSVTGNASDISLSPSADKGKFCEVWPTAKEGLQMLKDMIKNPIAKGAIGIVIAAGDAVSGRVCGVEQPAAILRKRK